MLFLREKAVSLFVVLVNNTAESTLRKILAVAFDTKSFFSFKIFICKVTFCAAQIWHKIIAIHDSRTIFLKLC